MSKKRTNKQSVKKAKKKAQTIYSVLADTPAGKAAKSKSNKKAVSKRYPLKHLVSPEVALHRKIQLIMDKVPVIEASGYEIDELDNDYYYTEAATVFEVYTEAMVSVGLTFVPIHAETCFEHRAYKATVTYRVTDVDTGAYIDVVGVGLGANGIWSYNSAQTVARKQALLNTFGASYPQPPDTKKDVRKAVKMFRPLDMILTCKSAVQEVDDYFAEKFKTVKKVLAKKKK